MSDNTQSQPNTALVRLTQMCEKAQPMMRALAAKYLDPERVMRLTIAAAKGDSKILECSPATILRVVMEASLIGLEINTPLRHAHLVPFKGEATLIIGYRGLVELARRAGIEAVDSECIFTGDTFENVKGSNPSLRHIPTLVGDRGTLLGAWASAFLPSGRALWEVMRKDEIDAIKAGTRNADGERSPWRTNYNRMAQKCAIRALCNRKLPQQEMLSRAIIMDDAHARGEGPTGIVADVLAGFDMKPAEPKAERMTRELKQRQARARADEEGRKGGGIQVEMPDGTMVDAPATEPTDKG